MFKLNDSNGNPFIVDADHFMAGIEGVVFTDSRGKVVDTYDWNEIQDVNVERVNG